MNKQKQGKIIATWLMVIAAIMLYMFTGYMPISVVVISIAYIFRKGLYVDESLSAMTNESPILGTVCLIAFLGLALYSYFEWRVAHDYSKINIFMIFTPIFLLFIIRDIKLYLKLKAEMN